MQGNDWTKLAQATLQELQETLDRLEKLKKDKLVLFNLNDVAIVRGTCKSEDKMIRSLGSGYFHETSLEETKKCLQSRIASLMCELSKNGVADNNNNIIFLDEDKEIETLDSDNKIQVSPKEETVIPTVSQCSDKEEKEPQNNSVNEKPTGRKPSLFAQRMRQLRESGQ